MVESGYVMLTLKYRKVDRRWTAYCEELGTATFGRSLPEADKKLKEAVLLHLNTLEDVGELGRFFRDYDIVQLREELCSDSHIFELMEIHSGFLDTVG